MISSCFYFVISWCFRRKHFWGSSGFFLLFFNCSIVSISKIKVNSFVLWVCWLFLMGWVFFMCFEIFICKPIWGGNVWALFVFVYVTRSYIKEQLMVLLWEDTAPSDLGLQAVLLVGQPHSSPGPLLHLGNCSVFTPHHEFRLPPVSYPWRDIPRSWM